MALDMSQFYQVFFEETAEHLGNMESLLLDLDVQQPDPEQLNAIFRAAHSIKGSSGTFGFTDLADVTHILENLLDRIRKDEIPLREDMIDAFLDAGDILKALLDAHRGEGAADPESVAAICARLKALTVSDAEESIPVTNVPAAPITEPPTPEPVMMPDAGFDASFIFAAADRGKGKPEDIDNLVSVLNALGNVALLERPASPEQPWKLRVTARAAETVDAENLREMLEFVARSDSIRIAPLGTPLDTVGENEAYGFFDAPEPQAPSAAASLSDGDGYGFFEPLPESAAVPAQPTGDSPDGSYGFFTDIPVSPVVVEPSTATPIAKTQPQPAMSVAASKPETPPAKPATPASTSERRAAAKGGGDTSIRVSIEKVDQLINLVGELVITQAMLAQSAINIDPVQFERLHAGLGQLERNTRDLQESVMSIRMMPISVVFSRFPRVVRDTSQKLGKQVELKTSGENTELDKGLIERISDPLTHLIRNSLDHGIESPEKRIAAGKSPSGTITLKAFHQSGNIVIEVGDDGAGLNRERILSKARERGLPVSDSMSDQEVWLLIFEAGFSTADQITEVSGRGVGMDVVKRNITEMGGRVEIESVGGVGTRMTVRLPLTLAILDGMSVAIGKETYIVPIGCVVESLQVSRAMIKSVSGVERLIQVRGEYLPVLALHEYFDIADAVQSLDQGIMIVLEADGSKFALLVDTLIGQHQFVIKSLEANYRKVVGISGATIMGDGHVAMILDVSALARMVNDARQSQ